MAKREHTGYQADVHCYSLARSTSSQRESLDVEGKYRLRNAQADHHYKQTREEYEKALVDHRRLDLYLHRDSGAACADNGADPGSGERNSLVISSISAVAR